MIKYSIIIPFHSNKKILDCCISTLLDTIPNDVEIIIVANNNNDKEIDISFESDNIKILKFNENLYYPKAVNIGVESSTGDVVILCDADTTYFGNWFYNLTSFFNSKENIGLAGSKLISPNTGKIIDFGITFTEFNYTHPYLGMDQNYYLANKTREVQASCSANCIINRNLFLDIGGFNEDLVFCYSDIDLCLRLKEKGYSIWSVHNSVVFHKGSSVLNNMSYLKADTKSKFSELNANKIKLDFEDLFVENINSFKLNNLLNEIYLYIDFSTIINKDWYYKIIDKSLDKKICDKYIYDVGKRDIPHISLFETLPSVFHTYKTPIIYFVDTIESLTNNHIWQLLRQTENDIIIDRNGNITFFKEVIN